MIVAEPEDNGSQERHNMNNRSEALAARLEAGAKALAEFAKSLTGEEWHTRVP